VSSWNLALAAFLIALAVAASATPLVRRLALHVGMVDEIGDRRMHDVPKPRIGGIAVYLGFLTALFSVVGFALANTKLVHDLNEVHEVLGVLFGGTLILIVGIWDDIMGMSPRWKFLAQIGVALVSMFYGFVIHGINNPFTAGGDWVAIPLWLGVPITLVWYLGMINAINFIDGLDGLLSGYTAISGLALLLIALLHGHIVLALILAALVGGALGFLPFNFNPAKIILGDSGALFIGYIFATVSIVGASKTAISISLVLPLVALGLPIADTFATIVRRTRAGRKITEADRGHFHHQLIFRFGLNVKQAVLLIYAICFVLGVVAVVLSESAVQHRFTGVS
jgi:UDP-GlcNAc:undecaprenyl-phosphate GlcNAc-1-phosphate transferase